MTGRDARPARACDDTLVATLPSRPGLRGRGRSCRRSLRAPEPPHGRRGRPPSALRTVLALQTGIIDQGQLVAAFQAWTLDKMRNLADILVARGDLSAVQRGLLESLADQNLQKHGDVEKSLAALPANHATRASLAELGEPEIEATLARVARSKNGPATEVEDDDPERTGTLSVGSATSAGQRFRILRPHARGGLGAVFVALDGELHRDVTLKQSLEKHADDPVSRRRFVAEAEITNGLEHPGVVPVFGLGTDSFGDPYYAMRLIKGDSLEEAIEAFHRRANTSSPSPLLGKGRGEGAADAPAGSRDLALRKLLRRFPDVCNAIDYAHSCGVIHRRSESDIRLLDHSNFSGWHPELGAERLRILTPESDGDHS